jgi:predicted lipoprotein with Yx(FWY)xxD motif
MKHNLLSSKAPIRAWFSLLALVSLVLLAACGSTTSTGSTAAPTATTASTSNGGRYGNGYGNGGTTPTVSSSGTLIKTATATVKGTSETILTNAQGMTLYYRTTDQPPTTVCSNGCASTWPPLLVSGSSTPTSSTSLPGKISVQADANGMQVEYNGHPLYTFSGDSAPGQTTGEGFGGIWHVVTPNLT